ncbi:HAMP domain-containing protein [Rhodohalobacter sp. SW132]|uniref:sensor histidine kinase n=1 Tax=Rhodohalobacter sp. SW132 TaxID=2293433 RepID=UPI000E27DE2D|nr:HAMP domain-containing sensor histidine kinase [Rhodohalobacter sp. SW132]REL24125.1 HAMP domain-containing protein [Rhodohalobacter sp. SW132]
MSIRAKLAWTFILLLIFGITAISSYSILFIRNYLLNEGEEQILNDTEWLAITIQNLQSDEQFETNLNEAARTSGYRISIYDGDGILFASVPYYEEANEDTKLEQNRQNSLENSGIVLLENEPDSDDLVAYMAISGGNNPARYIRVSINKDQIYEPIRTIRWIIYTGMFISMGLVILVSVLFSRSISKPIIQLESAARDIADGNVNRTLKLDRKDEFGTLAKSLNQMAERLRADNETLKAMYEKQRQFFADITHEIRNPLHTISGSLEMLQLKNLSDEKKERYIETAARQTGRINQLFKDLMTLQRYDSDSYFIEKKPFDIQLILDDIEELYKNRAAKKGLQFEVDKQSVSVYADPNKIEQVLENLVSNAVKYTNEGFIKVSIEEFDDHLSVEVSDSGIGISENHLSRLFDRFYRTDKARSRDKGGTGLGLAVVKSILTAHKTEIKVKSTPGKGSAFWFTLQKPT